MDNHFCYTLHRRSTTVREDTSLTRFSMHTNIAFFYPFSLNYNSAELSCPMSQTAQL